MDLHLDSNNRVSDWKEVFKFPGKSDKGSAGKEDDMDIMEALRTRRSVRNFSDKPVSVQILSDPRNYPVLWDGTANCLYPDSIPTDKSMVTERSTWSIKR